MIDKKHSSDQNGVAVVLMLISTATGGLAGVIGEARLSIICLSLAAVMAIALWTSFGRYLGVREPTTATIGGYKRRQLGALALILLVTASIVLCPPLLGGPAKKSQHQTAVSSAKSGSGTTIGYLGLAGSSADLRKSRFGQGLSEDIVNSGKVDAREVEFGVPFTDGSQSLVIPSAGPEKVGIEVTDGATADINGGSISGNSEGVRVAPRSSARISDTDLTQNRVGLSNQGKLTVSVSVK